MNALQTILLIVAIFLFVKLVFLRALHFKQNNLSLFEVEHRAKKGDERVIQLAKRYRALADIITLRSIYDTLLVILIILSLTHAFHWLVGALVSLVLLLAANTASRSRLVQYHAQKLYEKYEKTIITTATTLRPGLKMVREVVDDYPSDPIIHSREELLHLIETSTDILKHDEQYLLTHAMRFEDKTVSDIMTPRSVVKTVESNEVLGPIVLDRLHKAGHSRYPVTDKESERIVGILYLHDLISQAGSHKKATVANTMDTRVFYINQKQSLASALAGFLRVKHHLFIVVNEFEEVTGIVTIEDVIEALIGRKIIDEFDQYDDLRAVAKREATKQQASVHKPHIM